MSRLPLDDWDRDLLAAVEAYCNGSIGPEELARLEAQLLADPAARARFLEYLNVDATLHGYAAPLEAPPDAARAPRRRGRVAAVVAAGLVLCALGAWIVGRPAGKDPARHHPGADIAVVLAAEKVEWADGSSASLGAHDIAPAGRLALSAGRLSLALFNGVVVHLEGPVDLDLVHLDRLVCRQGRLRLKVPQKAAGFTIACPGCVVRADEGAEFALNVGADERARVLVYAGAVDVSARDAADRTRDSRRVGQAESVEHAPGADRIAELALNPSEFITNLPVAPVSAGPLLRLPPGYPDAVRAARPKHYWRFERIEGDRVVSETGGPALVRSGPMQLRREAHGNHSAVFAPGDPAQALALDGLWRPPAAGYAIEFWFVADLVAQAALVSVLSDLPDARGEANTLYLEATPSAPVGVRLKSGESPPPPQVLRLTQRWPPSREGGSYLWSSRNYETRWHHVTVQIRNGRTELYLDGGRVGDAAAPPGFDAAPAHVVFGRRYHEAKVRDLDQHPFVGRFDEIALYERPLTADEIRNHYELGTGNNH